MDTVKKLESTTLPEQPQLIYLQATTLTDEPSPIPSFPLQSATVETCSHSTDLANSLTVDHKLDPDSVYASFLSTSDQQRNEVRVSRTRDKQYDF